MTDKQAFNAHLQRTGWNTRCWDDLHGDLITNEEAKHLRTQWLMGYEMNDGDTTRHDFDFEPVVRLSKTLGTGAVVSWLLTEMDEEGNVYGLTDVSIIRFKPWTAMRDLYNPLDGEGFYSIALWDLHASGFRRDTGFVPKGWLKEYHKAYLEAGNKVVVDIEPSQEWLDYTDE
jgi:hypothetical protein